VTKETRDAVLAQVAETFPPELINRLDSQVVFNKLSRQSILSIVDLRLADVSERLKDRRITLDVSQRAKEWLADQGYSEVYGARAVARVVRTKVLFPLAKKLLTGTIRCDSNISLLSLPPESLPCYSEGDTVKIDHEDQSSDLVVRDNHTPDTTASKISSKSLPLKSDEDEFEDGFFYSSRR